MLFLNRYKNISFKINKQSTYNSIGIIIVMHRSLSILGIHFDRNRNIDALRIGLS